MHILKRVKYDHSSTFVKVSVSCIFNIKHDFVQKCNFQIFWQKRFSWDGQITARKRSLENKYSLQPNVGEF